MVGFNFAPRGWAYCQGQLLPISSNDALFSLLGTIYGGDGRSTFALPDLRGRAPIHHGQGQGLSNYNIGQRGGVETVILNVNQIPSHTHSLSVATDAIGNKKNPEGNKLAIANDGESNYSDTGKDVGMGTIENTGGNLEHENRPPFLAISFCIALQGIYPSRS